MGLKISLANLLDLDWFYYNQAGMLLEKFENLLELLVKQLVIQSRLASSISLGVKNQMLTLFVAKVGINQVKV